MCIRDRPLIAHGRARLAREAEVLVPGRPRRLRVPAWPHIPAQEPEQPPRARSAQTALQKGAEQRQA
eukprot:5246102-Alexandrium_andersonii.AAC.1